MGRNNRQRRAAKARKRSRRSSPEARNGPRDGGFARSSGPDTPFVSFDEPTCDCFECRLRDDRDAALQTMSGLFRFTIETAWANGWQPQEVVRQIQRTSTRAAAELMTIVVLVDDAHRHDQSKHPRWIHQVDVLSATADPADIRDDWLVRWFEQHEFDGAPIIDQLIVELASLPPLPRLIPPPGEPDGDSASGGDGDDPVLARVRALLAQAESTTFPEEAEAFTAKAQAMMSRHAIDAAMLRHAAGDSGRPESMRIAIDDPYVSEKADLLHVVAEAGRCRAVLLRRYALATVVGDEANLRGVEVLFTSLLLQAQSALNHESATADAGSHRRSRGFRAAFLAGYAARIGERLVAERDHAVAESGDEVLPVLARRSEAIDAELERLFGGTLSSTRGRVRDRGGWDSGADAADRASLRSNHVDRGPSAAGGIATAR